MAGSPDRTDKCRQSTSSSGSAIDLVKLDQLVKKTQRRLDLLCSWLHMKFAGDEMALPRGLCSDFDVDIGQEQHSIRINGIRQDLMDVDIIEIETIQPLQPQPPVIVTPLPKEPQPRRRIGILGKRCLKNMEKLKKPATVSGKEEEPRKKKARFIPEIDVNSKAIDVGDSMPRLSDVLPLLKNRELLLLPTTPDNELSSCNFAHVEFTDTEPLPNSESSATSLAQKTLESSFDEILKHSSRDATAGYHTYPNGRRKGCNDAALENEVCGTSVCGSRKSKAQDSSSCNEIENIIGNPDIPLQHIDVSNSKNSTTAPHAAYSNLACGDRTVPIKKEDIELASERNETLVKVEEPAALSSNTGGDLIERILKISKPKTTETSNLKTTYTSKPLKRYDVSAPGTAKRLPSFSVIQRQELTAQRDISMIKGDSKKPVDEIILE